MMLAGFTPEINAPLVLLVTALATLTFGWRLRRRGGLAVEN